MRDLSAHNKAMLCKFVVKVLQRSDIPCFQWLAARYCQNQVFSGAHYKDTPIWKGFKQFIPLVMSASHCSLGTGHLISFWKDKWLPAGRLCHEFPVLFSYAKSIWCSVAS